MRLLAARRVREGACVRKEKNVRPAGYADNAESWIERQYCASVAATLLARNEYFELLEDAMVPPVRLATALHAWRRCAAQSQVLGGLVGTA
jgi:hypothetical protein